jgi:hypothetical protein
MKPPRKPLTFDLNASPVTDDERARASGMLNTYPEAHPTPKSPAVPRQQLGVRIPVDIYKRLRIKAVLDGVLVQDVVERAVRELLEREDKQAGAATG